MLPLVETHAAIAYARGLTAWTPGTTRTIRPALNVAGSGSRPRRARASSIGPNSASPAPLRRRLPPLTTSVLARPELLPPGQPADRTLGANDQWSLWSRSTGRRNKPRLREPQQIIGPGSLGCPRLAHSAQAYLVRSQSLYPLRHGRPVSCHSIATDSYLEVCRPVIRPTDLRPALAQQRT